MTILLPTSGIAASHALRATADRLRRLLVTHLTRTPSGARHRLLTPGQIRWRRWKSALADYVASGLADLPPEAVPQPRTPVRPHRETSRAPAWDALDPPPRTAQSDDPDLSDDDRWADEQAPATDYALPNGGSRFPSAAEPEPWTESWPEASTEAWTEAWTEPWAEAWTEPGSEAWTEPGSEPWAQSWSEPWVEPQAEHADTYFAHHAVDRRWESDAAARDEVRGRHW